MKKAVRKSEGIWIIQTKIICAIGHMTSVYIDISYIDGGYVGISHMVNCR